MVGVDGSVHISLVMSKTKVAPIKHLRIPRLEVCGALLLSKLLMFTQDVLGMSVNDVVAWMDSTVVLARFPEIVTVSRRLKEIEFHRLLLNFYLIDGGMRRVLIIPQIVPLKDCILPN